MSLIEFMRRHESTYVIGKIYRYIEVHSKNLFFEIGAFLRSNGIGTKKFKELLELKDKYHEERCFIIATGPSLTNEDVLKLKNEYTFSMNSMCFKFDELGWAPTFYGVQDAKVFHAVKDYIGNDRIKYYFIDETYRKECGNQKRWVYFPRNSYYNAYDAYFKHSYKARFSNNAVAEVCEGFTITCSLIQIAVFMGFKEIYLMGCDCNYTSDHENNHFVSHGIIDPTYHEARERMLAGYKAAKEYADTHDIKIYNSTRGGMLELFERMPLERIDLK